MDTDLLRKTPDLRGIADIRLVSLEDGPGRGQRLLIGRNAAGVAFEVAVDRGFDISSLSLHGTNIGWHSPTQMPFPTVDVDSEDGWGFLRNFDGFMVTCGLDHLSRPRSVDVAHYDHPHLTSVRMPLHGRIAVGRAKLVSYGVDEDSGEVSCEGVVRQASVFGETLELRRRISVPVFEGNVTISDTVTNKSFRPSRHAILYHLNFGYPFLDDGTRIEGLPEPLSSIIEPPIPGDDYGEKVETVDSCDLRTAGEVSILNHTAALAVTLKFDHEALDKFAVWRAYQSGVFALGLEPKTQPADARPLLAPGERRTYEVRLTLQKLVSRFRSS